jgi:hypothetical protein
MNPYLHWAKSFIYLIQFKSNLEYYEYQLAYEQYLARHNALLWHKLYCLHKAINNKQNWKNILK